MSRLKKRMFTWPAEKLTLKKKAAGKNHQPLFFINGLILVTSLPLFYPRCIGKVTV